MYRNAVVIHTVVCSTVVLMKVTHAVPLLLAEMYDRDTLCAWTSELQINKALLHPNRSTTYATLRLYFIYLCHKSHNQGLLLRFFLF